MNGSNRKAKSALTREKEGRAGLQISGIIKNRRRIEVE